MPLNIVLGDLAHTYSVSDSSLPVPLGIGYVKAYADAAHGDAVNIRLFKHPEAFLAAIHANPPDIVGLANYGWNENLNRAIGMHIRKILPHVLIVAGGPNMDPEPARRLAFLERHAYLDFAIVDGGEEPFSELIGWWLGDRDRSALPGNLMWRSEEGGLETTGERPLTKIIKNIPSPYLSGALDEFLERGMVPMFETNRGCPFRCTFCAWGMASKDLVRRFDLDIGLAEIAYVGERSKARNWIVCDANFGILKRDVELARAIRAVKDRSGFPEKCHVWLAKNVTDRNLEIGGILGDMVVPVMAVQSLSDDVLKEIKRDNISKETYAAYQRKFHDMGSRTYSDVIVPLPAETLDSHLDGLRELFDAGVDIVQNHNMRLLAGAETNSSETRERFSFRTKYRLIHGDAGAYRAPDGSVIECFEHEESLRATSTMSEDDLFYLRKLHFLIDFCWNIDVYKPLLAALHLYGLNPLDVMRRFLDETDRAGLGRISAFWQEFNAKSEGEWFGSAAEIESYFAEPENFSRLLNREFEKLNIAAGVLVLKDFKREFDQHMTKVALAYGVVPAAVIDAAVRLSSAMFPPLDVAVGELVVPMPVNWQGVAEDRGAYVPSNDTEDLVLRPAPNRNLVLAAISGSGQTLSKVFNTQGFGLRDLRYSVDEKMGFSGQFRRSR